MAVDTGSGSRILKHVVEVVDEGLADARFGQVVRAVERDELAADALQLGQRDGRRGQVDRVLCIRNIHLAAVFARVVFLPRRDVRDNVRRRLVQLVQVVLLCRGFLGNWC